jgi:transposase
MDKRERTSSAEWQKRIERWNDSGLSAEQFAAELGINVGTLRHWKYFLAKQGRGSVSARAPMASASALVEVRASGAATATVSPSPFELELGAARKLRIPPQFDAVALERLLAVLEHR